MPRWSPSASAPLRSSRANASPGVLARPAHLLLVTTVAVFAAEALVRLLLDRLPALSKHWLAVVDASLLVAISFPMLYAFVYSPMCLHIDRRRQVEVEKDALIDQLQAALSDRTRAEDSLREADRRKTEFLAVLSHELRNPLTPIRNALWLLERAEPGGEQAARATTTIGRQVDHLAHLIDDLLDVTRISRGKIRLQTSRVDLGEVVRHAFEDHRTLFTERGLSPTLRVGMVPIWIDADPTRIAQVVGNLLANAAKFSNAGGSVVVTVERAAEASALVSVRDDGVGMSPDILGQIFEPFIQAETTLDRTRGGLGIGLSLVKAFVELHGGRVEARSEGAGRGAEFTIRLPLATEQPVVGSPVTRGRETIQRHRVLVIEDNFDAAETLREMLLVWKQEVEVARDGGEGLEKARAFHPDVVLCDIGLPVVDGYDVARAIRSDPAIASTFLVAVTGYASPEDQRRSADAGFDRHLGKPVPAEVIAEVLARAPRLSQVV